MKSKALIFGLLAIIFLGACDNNPYGKGMKIYNKHCAVCHADDGNGLQGLIPPIRQSDYLHIHQNDLACIIRHGLDSVITVNGVVYDLQKMPANDILDDIAITNLINFINNAWGNKEEFVTVEKIKADLSRCQ
ncbi:MAG TPA: cytochrome c [Saprospiraceae bacterium]|nr:cytochrome c [Saprospiraceae bacterium]